MAKKTIVEKAAEKVGYGLAMAEDMVGSVKTAVGEAMTTVTKALKKAPPKKTAKKAVAAPNPKKAPANNAVKKSAGKDSPTKKSAAKRASKKAVKTPAKKAGRARR